MIAAIGLPSSEIPAGVALINADGRNRWITLIQNAILHRIKS